MNSKRARAVDDGRAELPDHALAMDEEDLEEALEAAALDDLEEELE